MEEKRVGEGRGGTQKGEEVYCVAGT